MTEWSEIVGVPVRVLWERESGPELSLNRRMIEWGFVYWNPSDDALPWNLGAAQREAQMQADGLWGLAEEHKPARVRDYPIEIVRVANGESLIARETTAGASSALRQVFLHGVEAPWRGRFGTQAD